MEDNKKEQELPEEPLEEPPVEPLEELPEELALQMPYAKRAAEALGFTIIEKEGYEADDILGTLSAHANDSGEDVLSLIMTGDKDSLQLINDKTAILLATNVDYIYFDRNAFYDKAKKLKVYTFCNFYGCPYFCSTYSYHFGLVYR